MMGSIALFGASGNTGRKVLSTALEQGHKVRILVRSPSKLSEDIQNHANVTVIKGSINSIGAIKDTVKDTTYVISVVGGPLGNPKDFPVGDFLSFTKSLVGIMKETPTVKVFLHQAGAFIPHPDGSQPVMMKIMNKVGGLYLRGWGPGLGPNLKENDDIMKYMYSIQNDDDIKFKMIATKPGILYDGEAQGIELVGSEDTYSFRKTTFVDLAKFTVDAVKDESLYGKYCFVVKKK